MKILFIAPRYSGGIGGHVKRVADKLRENGFEIELMHAPHIPIKKLKNPTFAISSTLKAILGRKTYDVVHAFNIPSAFAMKYTKARKKVLSVHGVYSEQIGALHSQTTSSSVKNKEKDILKWADKLMTNSKNVQITYKQKLGLDFNYIYGPIDIEKFKDIPKCEPIDGKQVVYIGRDSYEKGIDILKNTEAKIDAKVVYCTDVKWERAMQILKSSDLLIVPSRIDNIPNVIKEALYLKIPIIATDIEGISEIITNNVNGILVPPENSDKLIEAINDLLSHKEKAQNLAEAGYEFVIKNLTWDVLLPKYKKFYEDLVDQ
jgi:glycosyltransferase involved in cell wall biosynthesis